MRIRPYQDRDFEEIARWLDVNQKKEWMKKTIPLQSTWVMEDTKGKIVFMVSLLLTNFREYCFAINFIGHPNFKGPMRCSYRERFVLFIESMARQLGYAKIVVLTKNTALTRLYKKWGWNKDFSGDVLYKEI